MSKEDNIDYVRSRKQAAEILGVSLRTLRRLELAGELRVTQISQRIKGYRDSVLTKFIEERTAA